jgi:hypothetical protein
MDAWLVFVPLSEDRGREPALNAVVFVGGPTKLDGLVESELGAGKNTNRRRITDQIVNGLESDSAASEIVAYQFVGHNCGAGLGVLEAEIAHARDPFLIRVVARSESPLPESYSRFVAYVERSHGEETGMMSDIEARTDYPQRWFEVSSRSRTRFWMPHSQVVSRMASVVWNMLMARTN